MMFCLMQLGIKMNSYIQIYLFTPSCLYFTIQVSQDVVHLAFIFGQNKVCFPINSQMRVLQIVSISKTMRWYSLEKHALCFLLFSQTYKDCLDPNSSNISLIPIAVRYHIRESYQYSYVLNSIACA